MKHKFLCILALIFCLQNIYSQIIDSTYLVEINKSKKIINKFKRLNKIPGLSISVSKNEKIIWSEGFGFSDLKSRSKVKSDQTLFRVASISKPIAATGLAKLVEKGKIDLDVSLYNYVSNFPKKKYDFNIRQLGGHTAGIRHYKGKEFIINEFMEIETGINLFKGDPLLFKPGSQYKYSSHAWNLISLAIEKEEGISFEKVMRENVFIPLKMKNTLPERNNKTPNTTVFYHKTKKGKIVQAIKVNNYYKLASGGYLSTTEDLVLLGNAYLSDKFIKNESVIKEFTTSQKLDNGTLTNYGIGWSCGYDKKGRFRFMHNGSGVGGYGFIIIYPKEELVFSLLTNLDKLKLNEEVDSILNIFLK